MGRSIYGAMLLLAWAGCHPSPKSRTAPLSPGAVSTDLEEAPGGATQGMRFRFVSPHMGTRFQAVLLSASRQKARSCAAAAFAEIDRLEQLLSEWIPSSEVARLTRVAPAWLPLSPDTLRVLSAGQRVFLHSEGAFDLTWAALRGLYPFESRRAAPPSDALVAERLAFVNGKVLELDASGARGRLRKPGSALGTGAIAKGDALDQAARVLKRCGVHTFLLDAGGQVHAAANSARPWRIGIRHPRHSSAFAYIELREGAVATSGDYEHFFVDAQGRRWHHLLDPRTGLPARGLSSVTTLTQPGIYADALATAIFVAGAKRAPELIRRWQKPALAVTVSAQGEVTQHGNFANTRLRIIRQSLAETEPVPRLRGFGTHDTSGPP